MSVNDKVDHVLTWGQYAATSQEEADEIIKKAKEMDYLFVSDSAFGNIMVWSLTII